MEDGVTVLIDAVTILPQPLFGAWVLCRLLPMRRPVVFVLLYSGTIVVFHSLFLWSWISPPAVKMAVMSLLSVSLACLFSRRGDRLPALSIAVLYIVLLVLAEFLTVFFLLLLLNAGPGRSMEEYLCLLEPHLLAARCAYTALFLLLLLPLYLVWKTLLQREAVSGVPELLPFLVVQSAMLLTGELMLLLCGRPSARLLPAALVTAGLSCSALSAVLWAYHQERRRHSLRMRNQSLGLQNRALQAERAAAAARELQVRALQKELRDRLQEIGTALSQCAGQAAQEQLFQTAQWLQLHASPRYCENVVVNLVMAQQASCCRARKIHLDSALELPRELDMSETELCSVFSNLMDNAVRACSALPEGMRRIRLSAALRGAYLIVRVRNPMPEEPRSAAERGDHGLGLGILEEIARRHDGALEVSREDGQFSVTLWLRTGPQVPASAGARDAAKDVPRCRSGGPARLRDTGLPLGILPLSQLVLVWFIRSLGRQYGQSVHWGGPLAILFLGLCADLLLLQLFRRLRDTRRLQRQAMALESNLAAQRTYLEELGRTSLQLRRLRHDINNHLQAVSYWIGAGELKRAEAYLDELAGTLPAGLSGSGEEER